MRQLVDKLRELREQLHKLETEGIEEIRLKRILADMGDDFRENEAAKLAMLEHNILHDRIYSVKKEILELKKKIIGAKM